MGKAGLFGSASCLAGLLCATAAEAQSAPKEDGSAGSSWEFSITPYLWFTGEKGEIAPFPDLQPVDVDLRFTDIFDDLDFAGMAILQARKGRFVASADVAYVKVGASHGIGIRDPDFLTADLDTTSFTATTLGGYRALDQGGTFLDVLGGVRISSVETKLSLTGPLRSRSGKSSETWVDPVVGARFRASLASNWGVVLYGDIGGFGAASDLTWQLQGAVLYSLGKRWQLAGGWREYSVDYDKGGFVYDVKMGGPILGVSYRF